METKRIVKIDVYLKTMGLLKLATEHYDRLREIEKSLCNLLEEKEDMGHISDCIWGGKYTADELFDKLGIFVNKDKIFNK